MTEIVETEYDGVRTVLAPRSGGSIAAGLMFRVGRADETLATSGISHLVEHLALHEHGLTDMHYNGQTDDTVTHFHVQGTEAEVVAYLNGVCAELYDLPLERLETEKQILRTEANGRSGGPAPDLPLYRYGAQGYGLSSYDELGLTNATPERVRAWVAENFTRQNAVLWITSDRVPDGLRLTLGEGAARPLPAVTSALDATPAWVGTRNGITCLQSTVPRSTTAALFAAVLGKRLFRELRQQGGLSYNASADYLPRDAETALVWALADADPQKSEAVVGGFIDVLAALRFGTIPDADLDAVRVSLLRQQDEPDHAAHRLPGHARNLLIGYRNLTDDELRAEMEAVTVADLQEVAEQVWADALIQVPALGLDWAGVNEVPGHSTSTVKGISFSSRAKDGSTLIVGTEGVSMKHGAGSATVPYHEVVAMLTWPDGGRRLIAADGFAVSVEPTMHPVDARNLATIDSAVPAHAVVRMPAREPDRIPQPEQSPQAPARGRSKGRTAPRPADGGERFWLWVAMLILLAVGLLFLSAGISLFFEAKPETRGDDIGAGITALVMGAVPLWFAWRLIRRLRA